MALQTFPRKTKAREAQEEETGRGMDDIPRRKRKRQIIMAQMIFGYWEADFHGKTTKSLNSIWC